MMPQGGYMKLSLKLLFLAMSMICSTAPMSFAAAGPKFQDNLNLDNGSRLPLTWLMPENPSAPRAMVLLQHGMMRHAENMMSLAKALARRDIEVVLPDITDEQFLDPLFPEVFAKAFSQKSKDPRGNPLPEKLILAGFSAGARFLSHVAALIENDQQNLRGVLLLDPVVGQLPEQQLGPRLNVPYFTILAKPSRCNADGNVFPLLESGRFQTLGFRLKSASHCDFEGRTSDTLCYLYCGLSPRKNTEAIEVFASEWISGLIDSNLPHVDFLPGGKVFEQWQNQGLFDSVFK
jgi:hypothetical protein